MRTLPALATFAAAAAVALASPSAHAESAIKTPGYHPKYKVEIEPHLTLTPLGSYGGYTDGFGIGARFTIPIVDPGFVPSINDTVGIGFGLDFVHYSGCYDGAFANFGCGINSVQIPVVLQWNFFVADNWSVFGEPGLFVYHYFFDNTACNGLNGCAIPGDTSIAPAFFVGGRYHFNESIALTMRLGFPTSSIGVSFM